jgi:hypothetical protein
MLDCPYLRDIRRRPILQLLTNESGVREFRSCRMGNPPKCLLLQNRRLCAGAGECLLTRLARKRRGAMATNWGTSHARLSLSSRN